MASTENDGSGSAGAHDTCFIDTQLLTMDGDAAGYAEIACIFLEEAPLWLNQLHACDASPSGLQDRVACLHEVANALLIVGATALGQQIRQTECALREDMDANPAHATDLTTRALLDTAQTLRHWLAARQPQSLRVFPPSPKGTPDRPESRRKPQS